MSKINVGKMPCENRKCDNIVTVKRNENNTLSYRCDECDAAPYAKVGTGLHISWLDQITPLKSENIDAHNGDLSPQKQDVKPLPSTETKPKAGLENLYG